MLFFYLLFWQELYKYHNGSSFAKKFFVIFNDGFW